MTQVSYKYIISLNFAPIDLVKVNSEYYTADFAASVLCFGSIEADYAYKWALTHLYASDMTNLNTLRQVMHGSFLQQTYI